jgi:hypothetical protein
MRPEQIICHFNTRTMQLVVMFFSLEHRPEFGTSPAEIRAKTQTFKNLGLPASLKKYQAGTPSPRLLSSS